MSHISLCPSGSSVRPGANRITPLLIRESWLEASSKIRLGIRIKYRDEHFRRLAGREPSSEGIIPALMPLVCPTRWGIRSIFDKAFLETRPWMKISF